MRDDISSKTQGANTELLVIADIKKGFVPIRDSITYGTRLHILLRALHAIRKVGLEEKSNTIYVGPIDQLQTIYHVRWTLIDENRRMLLAVTFDRPLEPYVRRIVDVAGPILDAILCHCEDYDGFACWQGHDGFARWVEERQIDVDLYGGSAPDLTVDDMTYLTDLEASQRANRSLTAFDREAALLRVETPMERVHKALAENPIEAKQQAFELIRAMYRLERFFPDLRGGGVGTLENRGSDAFYLRRITKALVAGFDSSGLSATEIKPYQREMDWFRSFEKVDEIHVPIQGGAGKPDPVCRPEPKEVQGGILDAYPQTTKGYLVCLRIGDPQEARKFLKAQRKALAESAEGKCNVYANIAISYDGLGRLGLHEPTLRRFPKEFRDGMEARAGSLGDLGVNHPKNWVLPKHVDSGMDVRPSSIDLVVKLQAHGADAKSAKDLEKALKDWRKSARKHDIETLLVEPLQRYPDAENKTQFIEHFGYRDGISQPYVKTHEGSDNPGSYGKNDISLGEILLGYPNDRDRLPVGGSGVVNQGIQPKELVPLMKNGTYLVIRKLRQNVAAFNDFVNTATGEVDRKTLMAKLMGRYADGQPLVPDHVAPQVGENLNEFDYSHDTNGAVCPFHAHVRRVNPRTIRNPGDLDPPIPRIVRRGYSYGPRYTPDTADEDRGLFFMAYNASIAEQFEIMQRWINGGNSSGVFSQQNDVLIGTRQPGEIRTVRFLNGDDVQRFDTPRDPFVTLQWGLYLFVPSLHALDLLSGKPDKIPQAPDNPVERGARTVLQFEAFKLQIEQLAKDNVLKGQKLLEKQKELVGTWKAMLEDPSGEDFAEEVWAYIRHLRGGAYRSPYGVLVGSHDLVKKVFQDDGSTFSTREYWHRMRKSLGALYLGMDPCPVKMPEGARPKHAAEDAEFEANVTPGLYQSLSVETNKWIVERDAKWAFDEAVELARRWLEEDQAAKNDPDTWELKDFAEDIIGRLAVKWFGLPEDGSIDIGAGVREKPNVPDDLVSASTYFFGPRPTETVQEGGQVRGRNLAEVVSKHVQANLGKQGYTLHHFLQNTEPFVGNVDLITRTLVGCTNGFVAATRGSFLSVVRRWIGNEDLWRLRHALLFSMNGCKEATYEQAKKRIFTPMVIDMQKRSRPNLLYRIATQDTKLGAEEVKAGDLVVVSLESAAAEQPGDPEMLFGGNPGGTVHACPGQYMALGVLLGLFTVIMEQPVLDRDGTFSLSLASR